MRKKTRNQSGNYLRNTFQIYDSIEFMISDQTRSALFADYPWLAAPLMEVVTPGRNLAHAYLIHGAAGIGLDAFAGAWARALLCETPGREGQACGTCASCSLNAAGNHPDLTLLTLESDDEGDDGKAAKIATEIKIDQVRAFTDGVNLGTHRAGRRVVIVTPAEALNLPAANALLKTLEEPPAGTVFLLVTTALSRLLPTIRSRCRLLPVGTPGAKTSAAWLAAQGVDDAARWLACAHGAPLAAAQLAQEFEQLNVAGKAAAWAAPADPAYWASASGLKRPDLKAWLSWYYRWASDVARLAAAQPAKVFAGLDPKTDRTMAHFASRIAPAAWLRYLTQIERALASVDHPLSPPLVAQGLLAQAATLYEGT
jgi:DNA polymerase-3 subunit delta'